MQCVSPNNYRYKSGRISNQRKAPIARGIASSRKVFVLPNWSARDPPVNEPTVAPARSELTTQPA